MSPIEQEARAAHLERHWQAHPIQPPVELIRPWEAVAFLLAVPLVVVFVVLVLAMGSYAA